MQPVTPMRQQQQHLPANTNSTSRKRRLTDDSCSRRSTRLQAAATATVITLPLAPSSPRDAEEDALLAPPLALTRKRPRAAISSTNNTPTQPKSIEAALDVLREYVDNEHAIEASRAAVDQFRRDFEATAQATINIEEALACSDTDKAQAIAQNANLDIDNKFDNLRDLYANGRALYNATTTSLAAPAEIPNKKPRTSSYQQNVEASASRSRRTTAPLEPALATPKQSSKFTNDGTAVVDSRRQPSKRAASATANAALTATGTNSTTKRRSASKNTTITTAGGSATKRHKAQKDDERRQQQEQDAVEWKKKYKRAFKSFVFYFDSLDMARKREAEKCVKDLGAKVESFFSKQVSHVVTTRAIPSTANKASVGPSSLTLPAGNASLAGPSRASIFQAPSILQQSGKENTQIRNSSESPLKQSMAGNSKDAFAGPSRRSKTRLGPTNPNNLLFPLKTPPKIKAFADFEKTESKDILVKAQSFGMKLWSVDKLQRVLERLMDDASPSQSLLRQNATVYNTAHVAAGHAFNLQMNGNAPKPTLPSLLRAEAVTGSTYERDLTTLRPDYLYFNPKHGYIIVEDSSGEFQPAHAKEYPQRVVPKPGDEDRDTHWPTLWGGQEGRQAFFKASASHVPSLPSLELIASNERGCAPEQDTSVILNTEKQSTSQNSQMADPPSYLAASGNSQIITSNIQSGTSTRSGQSLGPNGNKTEVRRVADGYIVDKRLARLGSKNAHIVTIGNAHAGTSQGGSVGSELARRHLARHKAGDITIGQAFVDFKQEKSKRPPPSVPKKPGYCENCRVRFEDFKVHTRTRKHRKFALEESNWKSLDELFAQISRPIHPELLGLYDEAGCEIPSDIEASDKEEDDESSDEDDCCAEDDSGFAGMSAEFEINPLQATKRRKLRTAEDDERNQARIIEMAAYEKYCEENPKPESDDEADDDEQDDDEEDSDDDEIVSTSEEEQALETASEDEDEFVED